MRRISIPATTPGYTQALQWLESHGIIEGVAVESTDSCAAGLVLFARAQRLRGGGQPAASAHASEIGKSDPIDAELAARQLLAGTATAIPKQTSGIMQSIRMLRVARESAVKARTTATL